MASMKDFLNNRKKKQSEGVAKGDLVPKGEIVPPQGGTGGVKPSSSLVYTCGHSTKLHLNRPCQQCRDKAAKKKRLERQQRKIAAGKSAYHPDCSRLPHGSEYFKQYDATVRIWTVKLTVPFKGEQVFFSTQGSSSVLTEFECFKLWREWFFSIQQSRPPQ